MMYLIMSLECLGYPEDHPDRIEAIKHFDELITETESELYFSALFFARLGHGLRHGSRLAKWRLRRPTGCARRPTGC